MRTRKRFTLVVIAIIAILAGLLVPLTRAKAKRMRIESVNQLKQMGIGFRTSRNDPPQIYLSAKPWADNSPP